MYPSYHGTPMEFKRLWIAVIAGYIRSINQYGCCEIRIYEECETVKYFDLKPRKQRKLMRVL